MTTDSTFYLNTFHPLVGTRAGRAASDTYGLPPFVDGSIRREPDFEHSQPVITCLCRTDRFAPRLAPGDAVAYMTVKGKYGLPYAHWRLVAVLEVEHRFNSHRHAAQWFRSKSMPLPSNLMVPGNAPKPLDHSNQRFDSGCAAGCTLHEAWEQAYRFRSSEYPIVVGCKTHFVDTSWNAPVITEQLLRHAFGRKPGTRNPGRHEMTRLRRLLTALKIPSPPSCP